MRKLLRFRDIVPPATSMASLERLYARVVRRWWSGARDQVLPAYAAALDRQLAFERQGTIMDDEGLAGVLGQLGDEVNRLVLEITPELRAFVVQYETLHRQRWVASMTPSGVNMQTLIGPDDVRQTMETVVQQNVSLVRNLSEDMRRRIEQVVFQGFQQRLPATTIARQISDAVGIGRRRATLIATDQTQKLSAQLDTERFRQAEIDEFEWVHSGKVHFRPWHRDRDGQVFKLEGDIKPDDMPGVPVGCGCRKRAVLRLEPEQ